MGKVADLAKEYAKKLNLLSHICLAKNKLFADAENSNAIPLKKLAIFIDAYLVLLAIVTFTAATVLDDSGNFVEIPILIYTVWLAPLLMHPGIYKSSKAEWACIKRSFSSAKTLIET